MTVREQLELAVREFNDGKYFECHDTLEELWSDSRGERRRLLQGLIQSVIGIFHATRGNLAGADSHLERGLNKLAEHGGSGLGIDLEQFRQELAAIRGEVIAARAAGGAAITITTPPRLRYRFDPQEIPDADMELARD